MAEAVPTASEDTGQTGASYLSRQRPFAGHVYARVSLLLGLLVLLHLGLVLAIVEYNGWENLVLVLMLASMVDFSLRTSWRYRTRGSMAVTADNEGLHVEFGPYGRAMPPIRYDAISSVETTRRSGKNEAGLKEGVLCPWGLGARPGVRIALNKPWGPKKLEALTIVVPDPERLAGFLRERTGATGADQTCDSEGA